MTLTFFLVAALAVGVAVLFTVLPFLQSQNPERLRLQRAIDALDEQVDDLDPTDYTRQRKALRQQLDQATQARTVSWGVVFVLALLVPVATALLYTKVGEPDGLTASNSTVAELRHELVRIANRLERNPDDFEQWARLGMAYKAIEEFSSAAHALRRALYIDEDNPFVMVELAETLMFSARTRHLPEESVSLLETAVSLDPRNQKALWLLGIGAYQQGDYRRALRWWEQLDGLLADGSVRNSVREQMQAARHAMGAGVGLPEGHPSLDRMGSEAPTERSSPRFRVAIDIAPDLSENLDGSEVVFVTARAADGPAAPLAVVRLQANDLPTTISLSDNDAMVEGLTLSAFPTLQITARVAFGGGADALPGDLLGRSPVVSIHELPGTEVLIDERISDN